MGSWAVPIFGLMSAQLGGIWAHWPGTAGRWRRSGLLLAVVAPLLGGCQATLPSAADVRAANAEADLAAFRSYGPTIDAPLTLAAAIDYALQHNVDVWVAALEREFQAELRTQARLRLLPKLTLGYEYDERSNLDAASSRSLRTGQQSLEPSYSTERLHEAWNIGATWSLLDFGIAYYRAAQQARRVGVALEQERRVRQNLALEVTRVYWKAVAIREVARQAEAVTDDVNAQLEALAQQVDSKAVSQADALREQARLLELLDELQRYARGYRSALTELATLLGLPPGAELTLAEIELDCVPQAAGFDVAALEREALLNRPELFEKDFEHAITRDEVRIAIAKAFPNLSLFWRFDRDENLFLVHNQWNTLGLAATWDLLAIPQQLQQAGALETQAELVSRQRLAVAIGILTQLHLAVLEHAEARDAFALSGRIADTRGALLAATEAVAADGKLAATRALEERLRYLKARAKHLNQLVDIKAAEARVLNTVGRPPTALAQPMRDDAEDSAAVSEGEPA